MEENKVETPEENLPTGKVPVTPEAPVEVDGEDLEVAEDIVKDDGEEIA